MNKAVKLLSIFLVVFSVSISYGMQNPTCKFCKDHGGMSLAGQPLTEEVLKRDPIYGIVSGFEAQDEKDNYLREMMSGRDANENDLFENHFRYHFAASVLAKANPDTKLGEKYYNQVLLKYVLYHEHGGEEFVRFLLDHGADPNAEISFLAPNALWLAETESMAKLLLDRGARVIEWKNSFESIFDEIGRRAEAEKIKALYRAALEKQNAVVVEGNKDE